MAKTATLEQKQFGKFYTPNEATRILCSWAIRGAEDLLLEPSFGGCSFLDASKSRLADLGSIDPCLQLFGCDIDESAFEKSLFALFPEHQDLFERFHIRDFLTMTPQRLHAQFDAVIGNPPYISHHRMTTEQKDQIRDIFSNTLWTPDRRSDLWVYFVLHSLQFLRVGGRMAWILPGSFFHSDYAALVRRVIGEQFSRSLAIQLGQKLFLDEGAQENTIVLLADGYAEGTQELRAHYAPTLEDLADVVEQWENGQPIGQPCGERVQEAFLSATAREHLNDLQLNFRVNSLGNFCDVRIGIVTGANPFFVLSRSAAQKNELPTHALRAIVSKFEIVRGLQLSEGDLNVEVNRDFACLLLDTHDLDETEDGPIQRYLSTFDLQKRQVNRTFNKRPIWHYSDDGYTPDAFLSYMHQNGPRLALNQVGTTSTNTVHRVYFHPDITDLEKQATAISLQSTFGQLCAEIEGRAYGSGVLKHEPTGAKRIRLMLPQQITTEATEMAFAEVDSCMRSGKPNEAQKAADKWAMTDLISQRGQAVFEQVVSDLNKALFVMRARRHHPPRPTVG